MLEFKKIQLAVGAQFAEMSKQPVLHKVKIDKHMLTDIYLDSIPAEHNPIYRQKREYDCSCCKNFLRTAGSAVSIVDNKIVTIFDGDAQDPVWNDVLAKLSEYVRSCPIIGLWYSDSSVIGAEATFEQIADGAQRWEHFFVNVPRHLVKPRRTWAADGSNISATYQVFSQGMKTISLDAINTVIELSAQGSLYRGEEFAHLVQAFKQLKLEYNQTPDEQKELFIWSKVGNKVTTVLRLKNTALGELLSNLSDGDDLDVAVGKWEAIMSPTNYKRPVALVTQKMIDAAKAKVEELGYASALLRRYATKTDVSVNDVLFVDRSIKKDLKDGIFENLVPTKANSAKSFSKISEVTINKFISDILPTATALELFVENRHASNFVSLIAPQDPTANKIFKWDNNFSWIYSGEVSDSIKERVKAAGGNVTGELCCRLSWSNYDDLDLHLDTPMGPIFYGNKRVGKGQLDIDMNALSGETRKPVENIYYNKLKDVPVGKSTLCVHQFCSRETIDVGFEVEIDLDGKSYAFSYPKGVKGKVDVAVIEKNEAGEVKVIPLLNLAAASKNIWGVNTHNFIPVELMCYSPNFWQDNKVGNKHYIFALKDCKNPDDARGFLNEYLDNRLDEHRKVFELLGSKVRAPYSEEQISGLGFSSTLRNSVICKVQGATTRTIKILF